MDKCKNHPMKFAAGRCKRCHLPVCEECKMQVAEGIFCSEQCIDQFRNFQSRIANFGGTRSGFSFFGMLKTLFLSAVIIGLIWGVFYWRFNASTPGEIWDVIRGWTKLAR